MELAGINYEWIMKKLETGASGQGRSGITSGKVDAEVRKQGPVGQRPNSQNKNCRDRNRDSRGC